MKMRNLRLWNVNAFEVVFKVQTLKSENHRKAKTMDSSSTGIGDAPKSGDPDKPVADAKLRRMLMYVGEKVDVRVLWGSLIRGDFVGFDNHMNLILEEAKEIRFKSCFLMLNIYVIQFIGI